MQELSHLLSEYGLYFVFIGMIIEGTTVILLSGALCHMGLLPCEKTYFVALLGAIVGDQMWYFIGKYWANSILKKFPALKGQIEKISFSLKKKADFLALSSRFIYSGAVIFPMSLAINNYSYKRFIILDAIGVSFATAFTLALGYFLSDSLEKVLGEVNHFEHILFLTLIGVVLVKFYLFIKKRNG